jgi:hypothetical protein
LRGDGSGDIEEIQFAPMRRLIEMYRSCAVRTTFLPDVMQQVTFRRFEKKHPELQQPADAWDDQVLDAYRQGHDIQLHLHSQWSDASYDDGQWQLRGEWSLLKYDRAQAENLIAAGKSYLENLLLTLAPAYRCVAFRASALALAPSPWLLPTLSGLGIGIDVSVAAGFFLHNQTLQLDYRRCEETFLPYYPKMDDARRVSAHAEPIVCVPLNHFYGSRRSVTKQNLALASDRLRRRDAAAGNTPARRPQLDSDRSGFARVYEKLIEPAFRRKYFVSDTGRLNYELMREMLESIRQRARASGLQNVPVVVTNHPKDIRDWDGLERFVSEVSAAEDISFVTLTEVAEKLRSGELVVRTKRIG